MDLNARVGQVWMLNNGAVAFATGRLDVFSIHVDMKWELVSP